METNTLAPDLELIENVKLHRCNDSLKILIERHTPLAYDIVKRFTPTLTASGVSPSEITDQKEYLLYNSALSFNPEKNVKFSTWYANHIRYECLNAINPKGKEVVLETKELQRHADKQYVDFAPVYAGVSEYIVTILNQIKDKRIKDIFLLRYFGGGKKMTFTKIGEQLGLSQQTVLNLHAKGKGLLLNKLKSNEFSDKI